MNKITKASIAAGAAVLLLMGGGGTLAYWNASTNVGGASISSGQLTVAAVSPANPVWKSGTTTISPSTFRAVPGDVLTFTQDVTVNATGDNLLFTMALSGSSFTGDQDLIDELTANATFTVAGSNITLVDAMTKKYAVSASGASTVTVTVTVTWPFGSLDNGSQNKSVTLSNATITLTQVAS